jgi:thymidylate synthase (FAD)
MKIVQSSATLEFITPNALEIIERAGRTAYQSEPKGAAEFVKKLKNLGHLSVFEHAIASFRLVTDRGVSHELVRHRIASFTQESTRYCDYSGEISVICPPEIEGNAYKTWDISVRECERCYSLLREAGYSPQTARAVLPTCLKTEIVITANFREWMHIFELRCSPAAHPQMKSLMEICQATLRKWYPEIF